ncbi:MAG: fibronectin type III domain-containing protein [Planctomycetes bacterium]|nr:fibronectin type III domain-containing protein [Planctomycetota bacterium]
MSKTNRLLVLLAVLFYFYAMHSGEFSHANEAFQADSSIKLHILPPVGIVGKAELTTVELFWSNSADFDSIVEGYFVYYWQTNQGFESIQLVNKEIITDQSCKIENMRPNTEYSFAVRAATRQSNDKLEKQGDFYLSVFSNEYSLSTKSDIIIELSMSNIYGGLFTISKYVLRSKKWFDEHFFTSIGEELGKVRKVDEYEIDFRTDFVLQNIRMRTIPKETSSTLKFTDPRDETSSVELKLESGKAKTGIVFEAILINSAGGKISIKKKG